MVPRVVETLKVPDPQPLPDVPSIKKEVPSAKKPRKEKGKNGEGKNVGGKDSGKSGVGASSSGGSGLAVPNPFAADFDPNVGPLDAYFLSPVVFDFLKKGQSGLS
ncbi:hypothetical protein SESBI_50311, partial [Sesbania bispinosa]